MVGLSKVLVVKVAAKGHPLECFTCTVLDALPAQALDIILKQFYVH